MLTSYKQNKTKFVLKERDQDRQTTVKRFDSFELIVWRGMLQREGRDGQFPYTSVFESTGTKTDR